MAALIGREQVLDELLSVRDEMNKLETRKTVLMSKELSLRAQILGHEVIPPREAPVPRVSRGQRATGGQVERVLALLQGEQRPLSVEDVIHLIDMDLHQARGSFARLMRFGQVERLHDGRYQLVEAQPQPADIEVTHEVNSNA